jgi:predicted peptidase
LYIEVNKPEREEKTVRLKEPLMLMRRTFVVLFLLLLCASVSYAQTPAPSPTPSREPGFLKRSVTLGSRTMNYRVYIPRGYDSAKKYPIILYLHGGSAVGDDNEKQLGGVSLGSVIQLYSWRYPERYLSFIAVFPQTKDYWFGDATEQAVKALDQTVTEFNDDLNRLYLTGVSLGGYGSWYLEARYPKKFAAVAPSSGGIIPPPSVPLASLRMSMPPEMFALYSAPDPHAAFAKAIGKTPIWIFHGAKDDIISVTESRKMEAALKATGGNVKYTEYAEEGHFIPDRVYTDAEFWKWLMAQRLAE